MRHIFGVNAPVEPRQSLKIKIHRIGVRRLLRASRLGCDQFRSQLIGEAGNDLILHLEEIRGRLIKAVSPKVIAGLRVDELDIDPHASRLVLHRAFEHVANAKLLADFPGVDILALEREGGIARDNEGATKAREVGGETLSDAVDEIILGRVV